MKTVINLLSHSSLVVVPVLRSVMNLLEFLLEESPQNV